MNDLSHPRTEPKFSVTLFAVTIVITFVSVLFFGKIIIPTNVWNSQWSSEWWQYVGVFLLAQLLNCHVEWFFHRYFLHAPVFPGFSKLYRTHHILHHITHTPIIPKDGVWENRYPIVQPSQYEASYFPWYAYATFLGFALPVIVLTQWIWPSWPIFITLTVSVGWSLVVYELLHAVEHFPLSFWNDVFRVFGKFGRGVYSFHQAHHALTSMKLNMAISGFVVGLPIADLILGTFKLPSVLLNTGTPVLEIDKHVPKPVKLVRWLDKLATQRVSKFNNRATRVG